MEPRRIAVLGTGRVGRTLGAGFARHGHQVVLGSRDPQSPRANQAVAEVGGSTRAATYAEAAKWAEWVFVCVPGETVEDAVALAGPENLAGKAVVDVSNAMETSDGVSSLAFGMEDSCAEHVQRAAPEARVVKAFNSCGVRMMIDPVVTCPPPMMPICGDDVNAKGQIAELLADVGWEPVDFGVLRCAGMIEAMTVAWLQYGEATGIWDHVYEFARPPQGD